MFCSSVKRNKNLVKKLTVYPIEFIRNCMLTGIRTDNGAGIIARVPKN